MLTHTKSIENLKCKPKFKLKLGTSYLKLRPDYNNNTNRNTHFVRYKFNFGEAFR